MQITNTNCVYKKIGSVPIIEEIDKVSSINFNFLDPCFNHISIIQNFFHDGT